jgi:hypothetical protein
MPALVAGIHVFRTGTSKTWMAGTRPAMTGRNVDGRDFRHEDCASHLLPGHDREYATAMTEPLLLYGVKQP